MSTFISSPNEADPSLLSHSYTNNKYDREHSQALLKHPCMGISAPRKCARQLVDFGLLRVERRIAYTRSSLRDIEHCDGKVGRGGRHSI